MNIGGTTSSGAITWDGEMGNGGPLSSGNSLLALTAVSYTHLWRMSPRLTFNYGLRWDRIEPWYEKYNQISTFAPGRQSVAFPGAPTGILYPTDPGVARTIAPPGEEFSPRVGVAYSPVGKLFGGAGKTSIRAGFGMFYTCLLYTSRCV